MRRGGNKGAVSFPQDPRTGECQVFVGQHAATPGGERVRRMQELNFKTWINYSQRERKRKSV